MRPFGFLVTILNTLDSLGKFDGKVDEGFLAGYSVSSKAFRVFNSRTRIVQETLHVNFLENKPNVAGSGPTWLFDIHTLTKTMNYQPVTAGNQSNPSAGFQDKFDAEKAREESDQQYVLFPVWSSELEDITYSDYEDDVGAEADFNNLETSITVSPILTTRVHKDHHEEGTDYEEVFALVARIKAIRLFLAYASFMGFMVYQIDVKSAFLYGTIKEEVYVCQPLGFEDPDHPDKVYKVVKALYGLHQAPRACQYKYVAEILRKFRLTDKKSASTPIDTEKPLLKDPDAEDLDVHTYRSMIGLLIYLTLSRPDIMFAFWTTVAVKKVNDVTGLQALVDKKKVVVTEATIQDALRLDDAEGVECLPNDEIFTELARMGYEKPSTKLTFYKAFFSSQWKFFIDTIL
nr:retrovirus-related Pol polyprotein from transposon TNT 1-94 [Tanacetum cinerariifolium]